MTLRQREQEGYFVMDHSQVQGMPEALVHQAGLPPGAGTGLFEAPTYTCSHCNAVVVLNPNRQRERAFCSGCNHRICDGCGAIRAQTLQCRTMKQVVDEILATAERQVDRSIILPAS